MRAKISDRLREFWDAGIHGPDFVWAATGPALEAYSKHPIVKKADTPGELMDVCGVPSCRAAHGRRLRRRAGAERATRRGRPAVTGLDDVTTYYLLHRYDFGWRTPRPGPASCTRSPATCRRVPWQTATTSWCAPGASPPTRTRTRPSMTEDDPSRQRRGGDGERVQAQGVAAARCGSRWARPEGPPGSPHRPGPPAHAPVAGWRSGKVDQYLDDRGLRRNALFLHLLQALIELAREASEERVPPGESHEPLPGSRGGGANDGTVRVRNGGIES